MKSVLSFFYLLFCLIATHAALGQAHTARPNTPLATKAKGYYEYLPEGYDANGTATYPLILFLHGIGEFGRGNDGDLPKVLKNGLPKLLDAGTFPKSFTVNGVTHHFIIISPQFISSPRPTAVDIDEVLNSIVKLYKVNTARIYITGLSYGGGLTFAYPGSNAVYAQRVAAILPVSTPDPLGNKDSIIYARSRMIAANNVPVWATHNERDSTESVVTVRTYIEHINKPTPPNPPAELTVYNANGHDAWTRTYNPGRILDSANGWNAYQWLLQYQRGAAPNKAPQAAAGSDQTITLPANSVTLSGSGTDSDGSVTLYNWEKISGPAATITSANAATTTVTGLVQGTYMFRLTVTDNKGATGSDDVTIIVNAAANVAPTAAAGPDQALTLPTNSVSLNGSGTDSDGSITGYSWTKISGSGGIITTPNAQNTTVTNLQQDTYVFRLTVTDNNGATATDDVTITVNAAANKTPVANAGADQSITLPANSVSLNGSGTDTDGVISSYAWTKTAGPSAGTITNPGDKATTVTGLAEGTYTFRLTVTDDDGATAADDVMITVNAAPNNAPTANAGGDQTIALPVNSVTLNGAGTDSDGTITGYAWSKLSGPAAGAITNAGAKSTTVTGLDEGSYVFQLTVTDDKGATATDNVTVTVNPANNAPVANAGADQTITLPANSVNLDGTATDSDGTIQSLSWTKTEGPAAGSITNPGAAKTTVTAMAAGTYTFRFIATDNDGASDTDYVKITVNAAANKAPVANAGADITITLPVNQTNLSGSGTDEDGTIAAYLWTKVSGPSSGNIVSKDAAKTSITGLVQGTYVFRLTVTDNGGASDFDELDVVVLAAPNVAPSANAGADQAITLPANQVSLTGSGTDSDGSVTGYAWTKVSGPLGANIATPNSATTLVTGLVEGSYIFRLTVTDNQGATGSDEVTITVNAAANKAPVANAGADQSITLPVNSATLSGSGTDADGAISSYAWTKVSGPDGGTLTTPNAAITTVTALQQGTYVFSLMVTDNKGATAMDSVSIEVAVVTGTGVDPTAISFKMTATPNPTANQFLLKVTSSSPKPVYLRITDAAGRTVEEKKTVQPNALFSIGHYYKPGVYHAEAVQSGKKTTVKLIKQ